MRGIGRAAAVALAAVAAGACSGGATRDGAREAPATSTSGAARSEATQSDAEVIATDVATNLDTVWSLKFAPDGQLWFTQRGGRLQQLGGPGRQIPEVVEQGEGGLMGLEIDARGRIFLMYTGRDDNRIVRLDRIDAEPVVLVQGIRKGAIHDGGRLRFAPDGRLFAGTGDSGDTSLAERDDSLNGKILLVDPEGAKPATVFSKGHRNPQGLCFDRDGRFLSTEHGPDFGDEINVLTEGSDGGWPATSGNGIKNWTPTIAPAGCVVYDSDTIPQWKGSMLFVTLKEEDLRRLTFGPDGSVTGEEVLYDGQFGRLRDVAVAPDGSVYLATSSRDSRGDPKPGDDRIIRLAPKPTGRRP